MNRKAGKLASLGAAAALGVLALVPAAHAQDFFSVLFGGFGGGPNQIISYGNGGGIQGPPVVSPGADPALGSAPSDPQGLGDLAIGRVVTEPSRTLTSRSGEELMTAMPSSSASPLNGPGLVSRNRR